MLFSQPNRWLLVVLRFGHCSCQNTIWLEMLKFFHLSWKTDSYIIKTEWSSSPFINSWIIWPIQLNHSQQYLLASLEEGFFKKRTFLHFPPHFVFNYEIQIFHFGDFLCTNMCWIILFAGILTSMIFDAPKIFATMLPNIQFISLKTVLKTESI